MRIDKYLAHSGFGTRKEVRQLIKRKLVTIDGEVVKDIARKVKPSEEVFVAGNKCEYEDLIYLLMNKKAGVVSAREDAKEATVFDDMDEYYFQRGVFPVGRLDKDTTGLLLLTNDGQLAHALLSPKKHVDKRYLAMLRHEATQADVEAFHQGIEIDGGYVCKSAMLLINEQDRKCVEVVIQEGKFHQVKRMFQAVGNEVTSLERIAMGALNLDRSIEQGAFRKLTEQELLTLQSYR